ncbi:MAG: glutaminyl-tRNA synthetase, partial [Myxococcota bacterium]
FDDTNPTAEDPEFVASIQHDIRWLGFDWGEHLYFASEYFPQLWDWALELIDKGLAYVCEQTEVEMRAARGTVTEPGTNSPWRDRPAAESRDLFERMRAGEFAEGTRTLRAKMDMNHANMKLRDPVIWRILRVAHHHIGEGWNVYPMYDYAHGLSDAIEGITHSICTLEFENNRAIYDWLIENCSVPSRPRQYEFARLALGYTVMSKRKLKRLVEDGHVRGWDDPRMPTLAAMRRRGYRPEAIRAFAERVGVAKANSLVDLELLEFSVRDDLNHEAPRAMAVLDPLKVVVTSWPEGEVDTLQADHWPHDIPKEGSRPVPFTREIVIERSDFAEVPPKKWRRLGPGLEVRLRYGYWIRCDEVVRDADGTVVELRCTHDPATRGGMNPADGRKPNGTIHWVSATEGVPAEFRLYGRLFTHETPDSAEGDFTDYIDPESLVVAHGFVEPAVMAGALDARWQFERTGYFWRDPVDGATAAVFNRIVALKSGYGKPKTQPRQPPKAAQQAQSTAPTRRVFEPDSPEEAERYARYTGLGLSTDDAGVLAGDAELAALFDAGAALAPADAVAKLVLNDVAAARKDGPLAFDGVAVGRLAAMLADGTLSSKLGKKVLAELVSAGGDPAAIVEARGWKTVRDEATIGGWVDAVLAANAAKVADYRGGRAGLFGFFIGQVMGRSRGQADPETVNRLVRAALDG